MIRGTTPTLQFSLPFNPELLSVLYVTISQKDAVVIEKDLAACEIDGQRVTCRLTQKDTLKLNVKRPVDIQVRAKTSNGDALASRIFTVSAERILKDGEI